MCTVPRPFPREFREDVVRVARNRDGEVTLAQIARDFGISESCLAGWLKKANIEDGTRAGVSEADCAENRALKRGVRLLEQENEVLRRAAAYLSQVNTCRENDVPARA